MSIKLPKDAEGRTIPLNTKALYDEDGEGLNIRRFEFNPIFCEWTIFALKGDPHNLVDVYRRPQDVYLEKPAPLDSWEKLLDDLDNVEMGGDEAACCYMRKECLDPMVQCKGCKLSNNRDKECSYLAYGDIAARIRKLRGESE